MPLPFCSTSWEFFSTLNSCPSIDLFFHFFCHVFDFQKLFFCPVSISFLIVCSFCFMHVIRYFSLRGIMIVIELSGLGHEGPASSIRITMMPCLQLCQSTSRRKTLFHPGLLLGRKGQCLGCSNPVLPILDPSFHLLVLELRAFHFHSLWRMMQYRSGWFPAFQWLLWHLTFLEK